MAGWSLSAQGFTGDVKKVEQFISGLRSLLSDVEVGTGYSNFSHDGTTIPDLHVALDPPADSVPAAAGEDAGATGGPADSESDRSE